MQCPKCSGDMQPVMFNEVEVDRCTKCYGIFFDHLERETLKQMEGAEALDVGDEFVGATYNDMADVSCPRCESKMTSVVHSDPFEIRFEACPNCNGVYFDAGEFKDYLEDEIFDQFQDIIDQMN